MKAAEEYVNSLMEGLKREDLYPEIRLPEEVSTLRKVEADKGVKALIRIFKEAKMNPKVGMSIASNSISITIAYPRDEDRMEGNSSQAILWSMLNMIGRYQPMIESIFPFSSFVVEGSPLYKTIPNICLHYFMKQTKVAIATIKPTLSQGKITLYFGSARMEVRSMQTNRLCMDNRKEPFWFLPSSFRLTGYDDETKMYTLERMEQQIEQFQKSLVEELWASLWKGCYFPAQGLWQGMEPILAAYFGSFSIFTA